MSRMSGLVPLVALLMAAFPVFEPTAAVGVPQQGREFVKGNALLNGVVFPAPPAPSSTVEAKLDYCELVLAELESQLPRKSLFRWLFLDRTRLASGFEKEFRFAYDSYPYLRRSE